MMDPISETSSSNLDTEKSDLEANQQRTPIDLAEQQKGEPLNDIQPSEKDPYLVFLDEDESPKSYTFFRKCLIVFVVSTGALCSTFASSVVRALLCDLRSTTC